MKPETSALQPDGVDRRPGLRRLLVVLALCVGAPLLGACDWLRGVKEPETVSLKIESSDVTQVRLVSSLLFVSRVDPDCPECEADIDLLDADTTVVQLPYQRRFELTPRLQIFLEVVPEVVANLGVEILVDDQEWFNDFRTIDPFAQPIPEVIRFVYQFADISF